MKLLTGDGCTVCEQAKAIIKAKNIEGIEEVFVNPSERSWRDIMMKYWIMAVPVLVPDDGGELMIGMKVIEHLNNY